ncbi:hypothetical protein B0F90DRAFT_1747592, partial [Multifurca ochricompacta]
MSLGTADRVTYGTLSGLFTFKGFYALTFSFLFGMCLAAYRVLPRRLFSMLQQRNFDIYFKANIWISLIMLLAWTHTHASVITHIADPTIPEVAQAYALALVSVSQAFNSIWIGPPVLAARYNVGKGVGVASDNAQDTDVVEKKNMKTIRAHFTMLHRVGSFANA